jgi:hypothetical protein
MNYENINLEKDDIYLSNVAKIGNSAKNIYSVEDVLSTEDHKKLFDFTINSDKSLWIGEPWGTEILNMELIPEEIVQILRKIFEIAKLKCINHYDIEVDNSYVSAHNLIKWNKGYGMRPHIDTDFQKGNHIVVLYYINDDYSGGEITFPDHNMTIKPKSNSLIMFPGNENYLHGVLEVSDGLRYTFPTKFQFAGSTFFGKVNK